ncbi:MAG: NUDIX domain-containing protein [Bradymonadia bacterium]
MRTHCENCGTPYPDAGGPWPRTCAACGHTRYLNPTPVAVLLQPVRHSAGELGLLAIRRAIEPRKGLLALPGGFIDLGESWTSAAARELYEETGVRIEEGRIVPFDVRSAPDSTVLIFGLAPPLAEGTLPPFTGTSETSARTVLTAPRSLAFPLHTEVVARWFEEREY